jgi:hypothetical protein
VLLALGEDAPYVMGQVGHSDPKVTLAIYAQVMWRGEGERERLRALVNGVEWAPMGTGAHSSDFEVAAGPSAKRENPVISGASDDGRGWFRTSDLSRVKRRAQGCQKPHQQAVCAAEGSGRPARRIAVDYARLPGIQAEELAFCPRCPSANRFRLR